MLLSEIDWLTIIRSEDFIKTHQGDLFMLTEREEEVKKLMAEEKMKVISYIYNFQDKVEYVNQYF